MHNGTSQAPLSKAVMGMLREFPEFSQATQEILIKLNSLLEYWGLVFFLIPPYLSEGRYV